MYDVDMDKEKKCFDSRTRAGCGRAVSAAENPAYNFDSRTRVRCDKDTSGEWYISINAPVWARLLACYRSAWRVLIRAPVQGATSVLHLPRGRKVEF